MESDAIIDDLIGELFEAQAEIERLRAEIEWHEEENQRLRNVMWATEDMIRSALRDRE